MTREELEERVYDILEKNSSVHVDVWILPVQTPLIDVKGLNRDGVVTSVADDPQLSVNISREDLDGEGFTIADLIELLWHKMYG